MSQNSSDHHSQFIPSLQNASASIQNATAAGELRTHPITLESTASMDVPAMAVFAQRVSMDLLRIPHVHESTTKASGFALPAISCLPGSRLEAAPIEVGPLGGSAFSQAEQLHARWHAQNRSNPSILEERDAADTPRQHDAATGSSDSAFKLARNVQTQALAMSDEAQQSAPPQCRVHAGSPFLPARTYHCSAGADMPSVPSANATDELRLILNKPTVADVIRILPDVTGQLVAEARSEVARADMLIAASEPSCSIPAAELPQLHVSKGPLVLPRATTGSASICPVSVTHKRPVPDPKALEAAIPCPGEGSCGLSKRSLTINCGVVVANCIACKYCVLFSVSSLTKTPQDHEWLKFICFCVEQACRSTKSDAFLCLIFQHSMLNDTSSQVMAVLILTFVSETGAEISLHLLIFEHSVRRSCQSSAGYDW